MAVRDFLSHQLSRGRARARTAVGNATFGNAASGVAGVVRKGVLAAKVATSPITWWTLGIVLTVVLVLTVVMQTMAVGNYAVEKVRTLIPFVEAGAETSLTDEEVSQLLALRDSDPDTFAALDQQVTGCIASQSGIGTIDPVLSAAGTLVEPGTRAEVAEGWVLYVAGTPQARVVIQRGDPRLLDAGERAYSDEEIAGMLGEDATIYQFPEFAAEYARLEASVNRPVTPQEVVLAVAPDARPELFATQTPVVLWGLAERGVLDNSEGIRKSALSDIGSVINQCR